MAATGRAKRAVKTRPAAKASAPKVTVVRPSLRRRFYLELDPQAHPTGVSLTNKILMVVIVLSAAHAVMETEPQVRAQYGHWLIRFDVAVSVIFAIEYLARLWSAAEIERLGGGWKARLRWVFTPSALLDLAAVLPALLMAGQFPSYVLRLARLMRLARLGKLGRFSHSLRIMGQVIADRRYELWAMFSIGTVVLVVASSLLYMIEGELQPDKFGSIPRALWWGIITLTTIGYGDTYPITALGKVVASVTAILGIGLIAAPTGILAAAFAHALRKELRHEDSSPSI